MIPWGKNQRWNKITDKVKESVEEIAKDLIEIYSKRQAMRGFQFPPVRCGRRNLNRSSSTKKHTGSDHSDRRVKDDMESPQPMERLVCGDVGLRQDRGRDTRCVKAVMAGKNVAVLVPTTVLAMQHFTTFKKRSRITRSILI